MEVNIVDDLLSVGETSEVTFSFSEKVTGFDEGSLTEGAAPSPISRAPTAVNLDRFPFTPTPGYTGSAT
ncbi:Ig-like domain-containing protein [Aeromonas veronii]|uniref:Ig-like domain-containing protein n=1 Tax=Aeromonas veronii TaxID=654 RepID=UPI001FFFC61E|nr:Ig-like domain-containing protein [Aeromonas veronii]UPK54802.1 Ig-like domain-containing protein [Aeromonas veronii]